MGADPALAKGAPRWAIAGLPLAAEITDSTHAKSPTVPSRLQIPELQLIDDPRSVRRPTPLEPRRDPFVYAARSLVLPGWGQNALGDGSGAFVLAFAFGLSIPLWTGLAPLPLVEDSDFSQRVGFALWAAVAVLGGLDAYRVAEKINQENGYDLDTARFGHLRTPSRPVRLVLLRRNF